MQEKLKEIEEKKLEEHRKIIQNTNINEITVIYFKILRYSILISSSAFVTFWIPQLIESIRAVDWKLEYDPNFDGYYSDAFFYGIWYQKLFPHESIYTEIFVIWALTTHILFFFYAWKSERYYAKLFQKKQRYQDLTLEFKHLPEKFNTEQKIKEFFNRLSDDSVDEVSLIYDLTKIFKTESDQKAIQEELTKHKTKNYEKNLEKREKLIEKQKKNCEIIRDKPEDKFMQRGFVTFKNYKGTIMVRNAWNHAIRPLHESSLTAKIRKYQKKNYYEKTTEDTPRTKTQVSRLFSSIYSNTQEDLNLKENEKFLLENVDKKFLIHRGVRIEDIHWNFQKEQKFNQLAMNLFILSLLTIIPYPTYILSTISARYGGWITLGIDTSYLANGISFGLVGACTLVDTIAFYVIDWVIIAEKFFKASTWLSYKFISYNLYTLASNQFFQILGFIVGSDQCQSDEDDEVTKLKMAKTLIDSTPMAILSAVLAVYIFQGVYPIFLYKIGKLKEPLVHDLTFGLSNIAVLLFNLGFYAPINPNSIFVVVLAIGVWQPGMR